jgi:hypothetical protein
VGDAAPTWVRGDEFPTRAMADAALDDLVADESDETLP